MSVGSSTLGASKPAFGASPGTGRVDGDMRARIEAA
jgi:hypothetical protein